MWTKLKRAAQAIMGTLAVLMTLLIVAALGLVVAFVGYFLLWGILGILVISGIAFLIWAAIDEISQKSDSPTD